MVGQGQVELQGQALTSNTQRLLKQMVGQVKQMIGQGRAEIQKRAGPLQYSRTTETSTVIYGP